MELTVLGHSGSYGGPPGGLCSGYLVQSGGTSIWCDCGNGTLGTLQDRMDLHDLDALVITHEHPDHCVDVYGLHVVGRWGLGMEGLPVYAPEGADVRLGALVENDWGPTFDWRAIDDGGCAEVGSIGLRFSRTDHPPLTFGVEFTGDGRRLVYSSDTGPDWSVAAFGAGADLVLSEATYHEDTRPQYPFHLTAREAGLAARDARAGRLVLTHIWPTLDPRRSAVEGSEAFGEQVELAVPYATFTV